MRRWTASKVTGRLAALIGTNVIIEIEHASHKLPTLVFILASKKSVNNLIVGFLEGNKGLPRYEPAVPEGHLEDGAILWSNGLESVRGCTEM